MLTVRIPIHHFNFYLNKNKAFLGNVYEWTWVHDLFDGRNNAGWCLVRLIWLSGSNLLFDNWNDQKWIRQEKDQDLIITFPLKGKNWLTQKLPGNGPGAQWSRAPTIPLNRMKAWVKCGKYCVGVTDEWQWASLSFFLNVRYRWQWIIKGWDCSMAGKGKFKSKGFYVYPNISQAVKIACNLRTWGKLPI